MLYEYLPLFILIITSVDINKYLLIISKLYVLIVLIKITYKI